MTLPEETIHEHKETATTPLVDPLEKEEPFEVYKTKTQLDRLHVSGIILFTIFFLGVILLSTFIYWVPGLIFCFSGITVVLLYIALAPRSIEIHSDRLVVKTIFFCFTTKFSTITEVIWDDQTEFSSCGFDLSTSSKGKINIFREGFCKSLVLSPLNPQEFMDRLNLAMNGTTPGGPQSMVITNNRLPEFV
eukprot:TRINITY_DN671_c0_g1_i2.p1 TRINITY_DN671_c0_g1~~TRINITY_DN671_c0_g1_i2.p1  ORF type:complete len:201 (+),score=51.07 TRINITY_DN671_c0_g1_i2:31-603(+)